MGLHNMYCLDLCVYMCVLAIHSFNIAYTSVYYMYCIPYYNVCFCCSHIVAVCIPSCCLVIVCIALVMFGMVLTLLSRH